MSRVVIADDQDVVRVGLARILDGELDLEVVAQAADGEAAIREVRRTRPDVVLMDIRMPILDGISATRRIVEEQPDVRVLVLTTFDLDEYVYDALRSGAAGFVLKDSPADELITRGPRRRRRRRDDRARRSPGALIDVVRAGSSGEPETALCADRARA